MNDFERQIASLSPEQRKIFEKRRKQKKLNKERTQEVSKVEIPKIKHSTEIPLSFAQQRLWFFQQLNPDNSTYNNFTALHLEGELNIEVMEKVFTEIVRRHESLRTTFTTNSEGLPIQVIPPSQPFKILRIDLKDIPNRDEELEKLATKEAQKSFDLTQPLLRITLLKLAETEYVLLVTIHHIISDRWSLGIFVREMKFLYEAFLNKQNPGKESLSELPIQYADWAVWQQQYLQGKVLQVQTDYWKKQLANLPVLKLPTDRPRPAIATYRGAKQSFELSKTLSNALKNLSLKEEITLFTLLLAVFKVLLYKYTNQNDIVVGTDIANRNRVETEGLIGFLINTLVLRSDLCGNPTFSQLLSQVRKITFEAYDHQDLSFDKLVDILKPERNLSEMVPLIQVKFDLQLAQVEPIELSNLTVSPLNFDNGTTKFELRFNLLETDRGLTGLVEYNTDIFDSKTITRMVEHYRNLLETIVANPQQRLSKLQLLTESEQHQLLHEWNNTEVDYSLLCIHELFEAQVKKTPNAIAVVFEDQKLTYCELNKKANQLAHHLRSLGVKPEVLVGICVERSLDMVIGLLAILKAGGAYVPLDPNYPQERIAFILEDTQTPVLLTQASLLEKIPQHKAQIICLDNDYEAIAQQSRKNLPSELTTDNLAYTIYTSGSTGKPKGVQIPHSTLSNFLYSMKEAPGLTSEDTLLAVTTYSFDIAALELFLPIIVGARLVIASQEIVSDGMQLSAKLTDSKATVMQATPATWKLLVAAGWDGNRQLKILCGGEALPSNLASQLLERCDCLWNMYGPTETTIWSAASQIKTDSKIIPISNPIANTQLYILDQYSQLVPVGVAGELCIGGEGLARGYFKRPDLSAEKFIPNPFSREATRLYKTGDLARYLPSGDIEYIGRIDNQVKVRGFRIELGEIEAVISQYPTVRETVVVVTEDKVDSQQIVAYVVAHLEQTLTISELRSFLESKLPNYMVPTAFVTLEALPLTPNGKIDRKALPAPELIQISSFDIVPASTPIENLLAGIWAEVLGIEKVSINNNFFELGGHSLIATRVISQIRKVFEVEFPLRYLFEKPTIAGLAKEIENAIKNDSEISAIPIKKVSRSEKLRLSYAQQRLWLLAQLEPDSPAYNIPAAFRLQGKLNFHILVKTFSAIIQRHEILRTTLTQVKGEAVQIIHPQVDFQPVIIDIANLPQNLQEQKINKLAEQEALQPFDLEKDLLLRITLIKLTDIEHIILFTMHHIISDGWSIGILVKEFTTIYKAFVEGKPSPLPELQFQYVDYAVWQREWLQDKIFDKQLSYWKQQLGNNLSVLKLSIANLQPEVRNFRGERQRIVIDTDLTKDLKNLSTENGVTLFMTLLAAFQTLLYYYTNQEDIVVGTDIANRHRDETENLIGFFVNQLVLRINLSGNPTFQQLLAKVRRITLDAYANQDLPFDKLVKALNPKRDLSSQPLFQVKMVLQNAPMSSLELPGLQLSSIDVDQQTTKFDLLLNIEDTEAGLNCLLEYDADLFNENKIAELLKNFKLIISTIIRQPELKLTDFKSILNESDRQLQEAKQSEYQKTLTQKLGKVRRKSLI